MNISFMNIFKYINKIFNTKTAGMQKTPDEGETMACRFLKNSGYKIVEKNFRCRYGEMDIVALEKDVLCFIEVKSRKSTEYGQPEEYVDKRKQQKLIKTSLIYSISNKSEIPDKRFDVVSVDLNNGVCRVIKNAFEVQI